MRKSEPEGYTVSSEHLDPMFCFLTVGVGTTLTLLPHSEKTCIFRKGGSFFTPISFCSAKTIPYAIKQSRPINKLQAVEAVWGQKRPHYAVVRLSRLFLHSSSKETQLFLFHFPW